MRFGQKYCPERKAKREIREIYKKQKKVYQRINERNNKTYNKGANYAGSEQEGNEIHNKNI